MFDEFKHQLPDSDPQETNEWLEALEQVFLTEGPERARFLMRKLMKKSRLMQVGLPPLVQTPYINTISPEQEPPFPGDEKIELRIRRIIRWNAVAMVVRANHRFPGIGGHLSTYASSASLYEVGFNHFFRGKDDGDSGDQIYYQGHAAPGVYARAFLEGRLTEGHLEFFRREVEGKGLSSYPHPRLMADFWEFPTVSMGLGPINAIYQARFNRYLHNRGIKDTSRSRVWAFLGDGETDEPEALGALSVANREGLDNLIFVVNCNLQRLDGPVRGNGKIIQELEAVFRGAGWNVIKVVWGREWDALLAQDIDGLLLNQMNETLDGQFQKYSVESGDYIRKHFFGVDERLLKMVEHLSDDDLVRLRRGGHDYRKLYAAYHAAVNHQGAPTVILAKTVKGWTLGEGVEARNATHQMKKMSEAELRVFRDRLNLPIPDSKLKDAPFYHPGAKSEEVQYLLERRQQLGGSIPKRLVCSRALNLPKPELYQEFYKATVANQDVSTTMAFVRLLRKLLDEPKIGKRIVPIIPDEARTFGMDFLFKKVGIYAALGQLYEPVDSDMLLSYNEKKDGWILEEGITEAGSLASFTAAGTCYATHGENLIPFYMFYSMFGFQRTGDQIWAFADARGRGFLIGGTAGRTTLMGEGLQHDDGHSHILASVVPNILTYDPAFHYELAVIVREGLRRMYDQQEDIFYYITVYNETYAMPSMPSGVEEGIIRGIYRYKEGPANKAQHAQLLGNGPIMRMVLRAQEILAERYDVSADVWSATSYQQLRKEALEVEHWNMHNPEASPRKPYIATLFEQTQEPIIAASDYMRAVPDMIARWMPSHYFSLGTDGFGLSDTREKLRRYFEVDAESIVICTLYQLSRIGKISPQIVTEAMQELGFTERAAFAQQLH
ncbi:MAG: pyruvate dehydrogenase (acetyl-transferring), homodimeric type [Acidobacteriota bacterium]